MRPDQPPNMRKKYNECITSSLRRSVKACSSTFLTALSSSTTGHKAVPQNMNHRKSPGSEILQVVPAASRTLTVGFRWPGTKTELFRSTGVYHSKTDCVIARCKRPRGSRTRNERKDWPNATLVLPCSSRRIPKVSCSVRPIKSYVEAPTVQLKRIYERKLQLDCAGGILSFQAIMTSPTTGRIC